MSPEQLIERRRATRIPYRVRVIRSGQDMDGSSFSEKTETITVGKQGASLRTKHQLTLEQEVALTLKVRKHVGQFEVVWGGIPGTPEEGLVGWAWLRVRGFWGVGFPLRDRGSD